MQRNKVKSSTVKSIGYDAPTKILHIEYNQGGVYAYHNVSEDVHKALITAKSIGKHIATHIKPHFKHTKV